MIRLIDNTYLKYQELNHVQAQLHTFALAFVSGPQLRGCKRGRRPSKEKFRSPKPASTLPPNCPFPCRSFNTVAFVFLGPTENSQNSRSIWRDDLFFFLRSAEYLKLSKPIWHDDLFLFVLVFGDQHQLAQFCGPICKTICPHPLGQAQVAALIRIFLKQFFRLTAVTNLMLMFYYIDLLTAFLHIRLKRLLEPKKALA